MSESEAKTYIDWDTYLVDLHALLTKIKVLNLPLTHVYGTAPHGLIPAVVFSQQLKLPLLNPQQLLAQLRGTPPGHVLMVDSVIASGEALYSFYENRDCTIATIYHRRVPSLVVPSIVQREMLDWVVLPYEYSDKQAVPDESETLQ